ncbi:hypothetical protein HMI55_004333 [Coelomomyces lativittatus]|nr:hypothetical protein HMI55_004333 [Coelomomyces lativittatus]
MRLSDSATFTRLNVRSSITSSIEKETELNEEEIDGVGETEGPGFAIGLASNPSSARKRTAKKKSNKKDSASPGIISMTASPLSSSISIPQKTAYVEQEKTTSPLKEGPQPEAITAVDIQQEKNVQALKNGGNSILPPISRKSKPKKNEEFETFKKGPGKELALSLSSAKDVYNSKKKKVLDLASELNAQMKCIRDLHQEISVEVNQAIIEDLRHDPQIHQTLVSESCQENRKHLKSLKQKYKESMENIQKMKSEMEYAKQVVESCRERLLREYDVWYISVYEALDSQHRETGITEDTLLVHSDFTTDLVNEISPSKPKTISKEEDSAYLAYFAALTRNHKRRPGPMKSMI